MDGRLILLALTPAGLAARNAIGLATREWLLAAISKLTEEEPGAVISMIATIPRLGDL